MEKSDLLLLAQQLEGYAKEMQSAINDDDFEQVYSLFKVMQLQTRKAIEKIDEGLGC
ncbi:hypothetical protein ACFYU8_17705 [Brevibacillus sp. NPDC003359]|uniref:hypothetical protein n=1 Tax=unclassified Brevibacillus TaxID=2684853 RepID=UPI0036C1E179